MLSKKLIPKVLAAVVCTAVTAVLLAALFLSLNGKAETVQAVQEDLQLMDGYDAFIADSVSDAFEGAMSVKKQFWIEDDEVVAPMPNQENFGQTDDPSTLQWLIDEAAELLEGQELLFSTDVQICPGSTVTYYLDETILVITWRQVFNDLIYTISEVKVAHPSQFRRYLANNEYDSNYLYRTTEMGTQVNAVVASSGDYYRGRQYGIIVYDGEVRRITNGEHVDTCYIDYDGNMVFSYRGELTDQESAQKFVDDNNISFGMCFGPILVDNGVRCEHDSYALGEVNDGYPRAALCQKDKLHYLLVTANGDNRYFSYPTIHDFASVIDTFGVQKAYTLDGGQTGAIAMRGQMMNPHEYKDQRLISDIIYFATALPTNE